MWQNSKTQIVTKLKNSNCVRTQKLKVWQNLKRELWQNSKTQIVTVVIVTVVTVAVVTVVIATVFSKNNLTPKQTMKCSRAAFCSSHDVYKRSVTHSIN